MCSYLVFMGLFLSYMLFKDKYVWVYSLLVDVKQMHGMLVIGFDHVYILGSFASVDYNTNVDDDIPFTGSNLMHALQYTSPMFLGIQYLPLISVKCTNVSLLFFLSLIYIT